MLDLFGYNPTVGALSGTTGSTITNTYAGPSALTTSFSSGTSTFAGTINDGAGTVSLTKGDSGTLVLTNANTYSGGTTLNGGMLVVSSSATGAGDVTLNGGILASAPGSVTISGSVIAGVGAHNRPRRHRHNRPVQHWRVEHLQSDHPEFRPDHAGRERRPLGDRLQRPVGEPEHDHLLRH